MKKDLTEKKMWESKWGDYQLPITLNPNLRSHHSFIEIFDKYLSNISSEIKNPKLLEIGCSPGRFLIHFHEKYKFQVHGIEYAEKGYELTKENLKNLNIDTSNIYQSDIFKFETKTKYDILFSAGFVEHFEDNLDQLLSIHAGLVSQGGYLFLSFPNFRYLNFILSYFFRYDMIAMHNLKIMNKKFFLSFAEKFGFEILFLDYFGGIHPGGLKLFKEKKAHKTNGTKKEFFLNKINSKYFSHYLGSVMRKK